MDLIVEGVNQAFDHLTRYDRMNPDRNQVNEFVDFFRLFFRNHDLDNIIKLLNILINRLQKENPVDALELLFRLHDFLDQYILNDPDFARLRLEIMAILERIRELTRNIEENLLNEHTDPKDRDDEEGFGSGGSSNVGEDYDQEEEGEYNPKNYNDDLSDRISEANLPGGSSQNYAVTSQMRKSLFDDLRKRYTFKYYKDFEDNRGDNIYLIAENLLNDTSYDIYVFADKYENLDGMNLDSNVFTIQTTTTEQGSLNVILKDNFLEDDSMISDNNYHFSVVLKETGDVRDAVDLEKDIYVGEFNVIAKNMQFAGDEKPKYSSFVGGIINFKDYVVDIPPNPEEMSQLSFLGLTIIKFLVPVVFPLVVNFFSNSFSFKASAQFSDEGSFIGNKKIEFSVPNKFAAGRRVDEDEKYKLSVSGNGSILMRIGDRK